MPSTPGLDDKAFAFIRVAPRPVKPRDSGLTVVADRGMALYRLSDMLESAGDYIDWVKIGIGAYRLQSEAFLRKKIAVLHEAGVKVFFAGDITETALVQGQSQRFYAAVKSLGADAVEVSSAQISMSLADKCALVKMAADTGLAVVAEAGQKGHEDWTRSQAYVCRQIEAYQRAGAWMVLVQGEGISEGVDTRNEDLLLNIIARFDLQDFIFQAKDGGTQGWFVGTLGNSVNLDIDDHQVIDLELMRRGIRKRGNFGLVGSLPAVE